MDPGFDEGMKSVSSNGASELTDVSLGPPAAGNVLTLDATNFASWTSGTCM